jgi:hypothetical protein
MAAVLPHRMEVSEVRRCLQLVRRSWEDHSPANPISLSAPLPNGMRLAEFCYLFIISHHQKRHIKSKRLATP